MGTPMLALGLFAALWLFAATRFPRQAVWVLVLWIPVQGWFQLNVFNDSTATVLLYEFQIIGIYLVFLARALQRPDEYGPPPVAWLALPFAAWAVLLIPFSVRENGLMLTVLGLRTYLLPLPLVWIGYRTFTGRNGLENVTAIVMLQTALSAVVAAVQLATQSSASGTVFNVPLGYSLAGVIRPPGTFSWSGHYGMFLLFAVPFAIGLLGLNAAFWKRMCFLAGLIGATVGLMVNTQRAAIVILAVILPLITVMAGRRQAFLKMAAAITIIVISGVIGFRVAGDVFRERIDSIAYDLNNTLFVIPIDRVQGALETPVIGGGLGIASPGSGRLVPASGMGTAPRPLDSIKPSESFTAALIYQSGVPGLLLFYGFMLALLVHGVRAMRSCRNTDVHLLAACIVGFQIAILLQSWAYDPLHFPPSRVFLWFWAGVLLKLPELTSRRAHLGPVAHPQFAPDAPLGRGVDPWRPSVIRRRGVASSNRR
jgi:hypothetical protein